MFIKQIYSMVVCFFTTIVLVITLSNIFVLFITLILPEYTNKAELIKYSTNENYLKLQSNDKDLYKQLKLLPPKELEEKRMSGKNEYIEVTKARAVSSIITWLMWVIVSLVFFIIHWKIYKNTQNNNRSPA